VCKRVVISDHGQWRPTSESPLPKHLTKAAGTLAGKVAELPSLAVETRQLGDSGLTGGSGALGGAAEEAGAGGLGAGKRGWARMALG